MAMFEELYALAASATLTLVISADEKTGRMTINLIPKPKKDIDEPALTKALSLTAMPAEFDAEFIGVLKSYREVRQSLAEQVEATQEVLYAAKAASVKKAGETMTKAAKPAVAAAPAKAVTASAVGGADTTDEDDEEGGVVRSASTAPVSDQSLDLFG